MHEILPSQEHMVRTDHMASPSFARVGCTVDVTKDLDVESALLLELNVIEELEILLEDLFSSPGRSIFLSRQI